MRYECISSLHTRQNSFNRPLASFTLIGQGKRGKDLTFISLLSSADESNGLSNDIIICAFLVRIEKTRHHLADMREQVIVRLCHIETLTV